MRVHRLAGPALLCAAPLIVTGVSQTGAKEPPEPFDDARLEIEVNATDGDAGVQVFADAEEWKQFEIFRPDGRRILNIEAKGVLRDFGLSELFSESSEPPFTELPFDEFKELFPEGDYRFEGTTIDGRALVSEVPFSHAILDAPKFVQPQDGAGAVDYEVIVTRDDEERVLDVTLSPEDTSLTVPPEFLDPGREYQIEVHASDASGNRIFTEVGFTVE
jgi:hypothetical protein